MATEARLAERMADPQKGSAIALPLIALKEWTHLFLLPTKEGKNSNILLSLF
jgi:hypothetical protein